MNCNIGYISALIASANAGLSVSVLILGSAMVANGSFFGVVATPGFIIAAAVIAAAAAVAFYMARDHVANNCSACKAEADNLLNRLAEVIALTGIYAAALAFSLLTALIPWAGIAGITVALLALVVLVGLVGNLPSHFSPLAICIDRSNLAARIAVLLSAFLFIAVVFIFTQQIKGLPSNPPGPPPLD